MELALHPTTRKHMEQFTAHPNHALLIHAPIGSGKWTLAQALAAQVLQLSSPEKLLTYSYALFIQPEKNSIGIESVRQAQQFLRLRTTGEESIRRVILLEDADSLTIEAQNALLKILEEPPIDTILILTASQPRQLLPTVRSRLQTMHIQPPTLDALQEVFSDLAASPEAFQQAYKLSSGLPGLFCALLKEDSTHPLYAAVTLAKELLQRPAFERLAMLDQFIKQKQELTYLLLALQRIAQAGMTVSAPSALKRWHTVNTAVHKAQTALERNANTKLVMTTCVLAW